MRMVESSVRSSIPPLPPQPTTATSATARTFFMAGPPPGAGIGLGSRKRWRRNGQRKSRACPDRRISDVERRYSPDTIGATGSVTMATQREKAARLRELHQGQGLLVLPNAWDVASARLIEAAGAAAIA